MTNAGLRVFDSTAVACSVLVHPGDSLPPQIGAVAVGPSGLLAWESGGRSLIVVQSSEGRETRIAGVPGNAGFVAAKAMGWRGDTLWISDLNSTRVQRFGPDGKWRGVLTASDFATWIPSGDGRLRAIAPFGITKGVPDTVRALIVTTPGSRRIDTLARFPTPPRKFIMAKSGPFPDPLTEYTVVSGSVDASRWCAGLSLPDGFHLRCVGANGKQLSDVLVSLDRRPVTEEIFALVVGATMREGMRDLIQIRHLITRPEFLPRVFQIRLNRDGSTWLMRSDPSEPIQRWLRLGPDGTPRDEWQLPRRLAFREMSGDTIWAAESDAAGLQTLTRCIARP